VLAIKILEEPLAFTFRVKHPVVSQVVTKFSETLLALFSSHDIWSKCRGRRFLENLCKHTKNRGNVITHTAISVKAQDFIGRQD
jgi:hypothetical protein